MGKTALKGRKPRLKAELVYCPVGSIRTVLHVALISRYGHASDIVDKLTCHIEEDMLTGMWPNTEAAVMLYRIDGTRLKCIDATSDGETIQIFDIQKDTELVGLILSARAESGILTGTINQIHAWLSKNVKVKYDASDIIEHTVAVLERS